MGHVIRDHIHSLIYLAAFGVARHETAEVIDQHEKWGTKSRSCWAMIYKHCVLFVSAVGEHPGARQLILVACLGCCQFRALTADPVTRVRLAFPEAERCGGGRRKPRRPARQALVLAGLQGMKPRPHLPPALRHGV